MTPGTGRSTTSSFRRSSVASSFGPPIRFTPQNFLDEGAPACRDKGVDPNWFFPPVGGSPAAAKQVCRRCEVRGPCRDWALAQPWRDLFGVYGAMTQQER